MLNDKPPLSDGSEGLPRLTTNENIAVFRKDGRLFDVLYSQQFDRPFLDFICDLTDKIRKLGQTKSGLQALGRLLRHKRASLYFAQPSTRTFLSFVNACNILGISTSEIRDPRTSSELKGESAEDTIRTFACFVDLIVVRHFEPGFTEMMARILHKSGVPVQIINAGSGPDQHPTQALLDIYTLQRAFKNRGGIDGKVLAMVGDLKRGRTVRSLSYLMKNYRDVSLYFVSPDSFRIGEDIKEFLISHNLTFIETDKLKDILPLADAIYMTRIQEEYSQDPTHEQDFFVDFRFTRDSLSQIGPNCVIMHPLPRVREIEVAVDEDPRARYWQQVRNGMWVRAALLCYLFGVEQEIYAESNNPGDS